MAFRDGSVFNLLSYLYTIIVVEIQNQLTTIGQIFPTAPSPGSHYFKYKQGAETPVLLASCEFYPGA